MDTDKLQTPVTEIELVEFMHCENMLPAGRDILSRLAFQRDLLLKEKANNWASSDNQIVIASGILWGHDLLEESEKLLYIAKICNCCDCKEYRTGLPTEVK